MSLCQLAHVGNCTTKKKKKKHRIIGKESSMFVIKIGRNLYWVYRPWGWGREGGPSFEIIYSINACYSKKSWTDIMAPSYQVVAEVTSEQMCKNRTAHHFLRMCGASEGLRSLLGGHRKTVWNSLPVILEWTELLRGLSCVGINKSKTQHLDLTNF